MTSIATRVKLRLIPATIRYSLDMQYYYISWGAHMPHYWFSIATYAGPVPEERKNDGLVGWLQVNKDSGEIYHRKILSFTFWDVKPQRDYHSISKDDDLFCDYAANEGWR